MAIYFLTIASSVNSITSDRLGLASSTITLLLFLVGVVKCVIGPIRSNKKIAELCANGAAEIANGNITEGRSLLTQAVNYPKTLFTKKKRLLAHLNYAESFQEGDAASLENLKKAESEYSKIDEVLVKKGQVPKSLFSTYIFMCVNRVDVLNKIYKHTQDETLLLPAIAYGETAICNLHDERLLALVKTTVATTYRTLAEKNKNIQNLKQSIAYSEDALQYYEAKDNASEIIKLHNNLGNSYTLLCIEFEEAEKENGSKNYTTAYSHFQKAISMSPYTIYPEHYARNYMNLGVLIYKNICHKPDSDPNFLFEAKADLIKALKIYTPQEYPFEYASCEMNLLLVVSYQGILCQNKQLVEEAITHGENALKVYSSQNYPAYNLRLHQILGNTYDFLAGIIFEEDLSENGSLLFVDCCSKAIDHLEFMALEQHSPLDVLRILSKLISLSIDILRVQPISRENELKYNASIKKYQNKFQEVARNCPEALEQFKQECPLVPDDAEIILEFPEK